VAGVGVVLCEGGNCCGDKLMRADMIQRMETIARWSSSCALQVPYVQQEGFEVAVGGSGEDTQSPSDSAVTLFDQCTGHRCQYFCSAGGIRHLPENFVFPKMSLVTLITSASAVMRA
jgi:hypothetical protein